MIRTSPRNLGENPVRVTLAALVVLLCASTLAIAQAGQLDSTFGTGGIFTGNFGDTFGATANALAIQSDGKFVVGGGGGAGGKAGLARVTTNGGDANANFAVARYLAQ